MIPQPPPGMPGTGADVRHPENLSLVFQELFTVIERMRSNRQPISDAVSFRMSVREALKAGDQEGRKRGYTAEDIQLAIFAVVAFLDETILNMRNPVFADWPRQPLQEELFGHHIAGEIFFQNLQTLLGRNDSQDLADLLEIYLLCMLLGFAGRYSIGGRGELRSIVEQTGEKIRRIRKSKSDLSPSWQLPPEGARAAAQDPWVRWLLIGAGSSVLLAILLFVIFTWRLHSGVTALESIAASGKI
jgi:type VI secretion system protein ImpK